MCEVQGLTPSGKMGDNCLFHTIWIHCFNTLTALISICWLDVCWGGGGGVLHGDCVGKLVFGTATIHGTYYVSRVNSLQLKTKNQLDLQEKCHIRQFSVLI